MSILVIAEPVLHDNWRTSQRGRLFALALGQSYRVVVALDHADVDRFHVWAKMEGVKGVQEVLPSILPATLRGTNPRVAQVDHMAARGYEIEALLDPDPDNIAEALQHGYNGLLWADAKFARPEWRPDFTGKMKSWEDMASEIQHQRYLASQLEA